MGKKRNDEKRRDEALVAYGRIIGLAEASETAMPALIHFLSDATPEVKTVMESFVGYFRQSRETAEREVAELMKKHARRPVAK